MRVWSLAFFSSLLALRALPQSGPDSDPDDRIGYVDSVFHHGSVDSINLYNGQLTVPIALGPSYPIGPKLRYQMMLVYNSRVSEYGRPQGGQPPGYIYKPLIGDPALGIGWTLTAGKIGWCGPYLNQSPNPTGVCYQRPDGAEIYFNTYVANSTYVKPRDGSNYLLHLPSGNLTSQPEMWDPDGNHYVFGWHVTGFDESPFDYRRDFGRGRDGWYVTLVEDPFRNQYRVAYQPSTSLPSWTYSDGTSCPEMRMLAPTPPNNWIPATITFPSGQFIAISLHQTANTDNRLMINQIDFPGNGSANMGSWTITYRSGGDPYQHVCAPQTVNVSLEEIASINLPGGAGSYQFGYSANCGTGRLTDITLPTGGTIHYQYQVYQFYHGRVPALPQGCDPTPPSGLFVKLASLCSDAHGPQVGPLDPPNCQSNLSPWLDPVLGVGRRTETVGGVAAVTDYVQYALPYGLMASSGPDTTNSQSLTVLVHPADVDLKRRAEAHLFSSASPFDTTESHPGDNVGAEVGSWVFDGDASAGGGPFTQPVCGPASSSEYAFCPDKGIRVVQRTYAYDVCEAGGLGANCDRRQVTEVTCYGGSASDGTCGSFRSHSVTNSLGLHCGQGPGYSTCTWESAGRHYDTETHSDTTLPGLNRTILTYWNTANWPTDPNFMTGPGLNQFSLPNLFGRRSDTLGASVHDEFFYYDTSTLANGFLKGKAVWDAPTTRIFGTCFYPDPTAVGNPQQVVTGTANIQQNGIPYTNLCASTFATYPTGILGLNNDAFGKQFTYSNGKVASARWLNDHTPANWYAKRYDRDASTGWIQNAYDGAATAALHTVYTYDGLGRMATIAPPGESTMYFCYTSPTLTTAARSASILACPVTATTPNVETFEQYDYDGLGRLIREHRLMPAGHLAKRFYLFDGAGHRYFGSEWLDDGASETVSSTTATTCVFSGGSYSTDRPPAAPGTYSLCFDPFGRPQQTVGPNFSSLQTVSRTDGTTAYSDTKESVTTACVGVTMSGSGSCGSNDTLTVNTRDAYGRLMSVLEPDGLLTSYTYDVNNKLTSVHQPPLPDRTFTWTPWGFLAQESTPERGTVQNLCYGSLGNLILDQLPSTPNYVQRARLYDFAGRVASVLGREDGHSFNNPCLGQPAPNGSSTYLQNTYDNGSVEPTAGKLLSRVATNYSTSPVTSVTDDFTYDSATGKTFTMRTRLQPPATQLLDTTQTWLYNDLGLIAHHYHPRQTGQVPFVVSTTYDTGLPVVEYANGMPLVTNVTYQRSGALASYQTGIYTGVNSFGTTVNTTIAQDSSLLPRPSFISSAGGASSFGTGNYGYDGVGNILSMGTDTFKYDNKSRLTSAVLSGIGTTNCQFYVYDALGNLTSRTTGQSPPPCSSGGVTKIFCNSGTCANNKLDPGNGTYDRGNLTLDAMFLNESFTYDALDRLKTSSLSSAMYIYDGGNERVGRSMGTWSFTLRDEKNLLASEFSGAGSPTLDNVFLGNQLVASYTPTATSLWSLYASDHLGTPRLITNLTATTLDMPRSWPYGEDIGTPLTPERLRFASMERDTEGSRYHDHARGHEFNLGRFLSPDLYGGAPTDAQSWNRYSYVRSNPIRLVDHNGKWWTVPDLDLASRFSGAAARFASAVAHAQNIFFAHPFAEIGTGFRVGKVHGEARVRVSPISDASRQEAGATFRGEIGVGLKGTKFETGAFGEVTVKASPQGVTLEGDKGAFVGSRTGTPNEPQGDTSGQLAFDVGAGPGNGGALGVELGVDLIEGLQTIGDLGSGVIELGEALVGLGGDAVAAQESGSTVAAPCGPQGGGPPC